MSPIFKKILFSFTIYLLIFIAVLILSSLSIIFFTNKLNNLLEERANIIKMLASQQLTAQQNFLISSKISELEKKYKINFNELKNQLLSFQFGDKERIKNFLSEIAKENNLELRSILAEELGDVYSIEFEGDINDIVKLEKSINSKKLRLFIEEARMIKQDKNYVIKVILSAF